MRARCVRAYRGDLFDTAIRSEASLKETLDWMHSAFPDSESYA